VFAEPASVASVTGAPATLQQALDWYASGDDTRAARAFATLAEQGSPVAMHNLAAMLLRGEVHAPAVGGAEASEPQASRDARTAQVWWLRAADLGFVTAMYALGELHDGDRLGPPDPGRALAWYSMAAERGSTDAQVWVATAYYLGRGTARDPAQALSWYRRAAAGGDMGAQYIVAAMYEQGDGVPVDLRLARYWYAAAADQGDLAAPFKLQELDAKLGEAGDRRGEGGPARSPEDNASDRRP